LFLLRSAAKKAKAHCFIFSQIQTFGRVFEALIWVEILKKVKKTTPAQTLFRFLCYAYAAQRFSKKRLEQYFVELSCRSSHKP
jgi:hypothetical protein